MKTIYEGRALYRGQDEPMEGLIHGKGYFIRVKQMKNGKMRVDINYDLTVAILHHRTYQDMIDVTSDFIFEAKADKQ